MKRNRPDLKPDNTLPELIDEDRQQKAQTSQKKKKSDISCAVAATTMGEGAEAKKKEKTWLPVNWSNPIKTLKRNH